MSGWVYYQRMTFLHCGVPLDFVGLEAQIDDGDEIGRDVMR
jgi:hypothetical protein